MARKRGVRKTRKKVGKIVSKERVSSGIVGFDELIGSGFEKNSVNLIVGGSGSAKTIFSMHFLVEGMKNGENGMYITFEEKREEFFKNMLQFGWDLAKYEKEGKFFFLEYNPEKVKIMLEEGGGTIESIVTRNKISRMVIDSVSSFALLFSEELEKREAALSLFDIIRKWKCTSLLTLQEEPNDRRNGSSSSLEFEADSIVLLYFLRLRDKRERFVEILKMRGTKHSTEIHVFNIDKNGISIGNRILRDSVHS